MEEKRGYYKMSSENRLKKVDQSSILQLSNQKNYGFLRRVAVPSTGGEKKDWSQKMSILIQKGVVKDNLVLLEKRIDACGSKFTEFELYLIDWFPPYFKKYEGMRYQLDIGMKKYPAHENAENRVRYVKLWYAQDGKVSKTKYNQYVVYVRCRQ